jgi:hypothetical protein
MGQYLSNIELEEIDSLKQAAERLAKAAQAVLDYWDLPAIRMLSDTEKDDPMTAELRAATTAVKTKL